MRRGRGTSGEVLLEGADALEGGAVEDVHDFLGEVEVDGELGLEGLELGHGTEGLGDVVATGLGENEDENEGWGWG